MVIKQQRRVYRRLTFIVLAPTAYVKVRTRSRRLQDASPLSSVTEGIFEHARTKEQSNRSTERHLSPQLICLELLLALAHPPTASRRPASALRGNRRAEADVVRGGVRVKELLARADNPEGEEAHALLLRMLLPCGHL